MVLIWPSKEKARTEMHAQVLGLGAQQKLVRGALAGNEPSWRTVPATARSIESTTLHPRLDDGVSSGLRNAPTSRTCTFRGTARIGSNSSSSLNGVLAESEQPLCR